MGVRLRLPPVPSMSCLVPFRPVWAEVSAVVPSFKLPLQNFDLCLVDDRDVLETQSITNGLITRVIGILWRSLALVLLMYTVRSSGRRRM